MSASISLEDMYCLRWIQKGNFMKTLFKNNNRGRSTLYILFALAILSFVVLFFCQNLMPENVFYLSLTFILMCIMSMGGLIIQIRSGPPWQVVGWCMRQAGIKADKSAPTEHWVRLLMCKVILKNPGNTWVRRVGLGRLELPAHGLGNRCSIH